MNASSNPEGPRGFDGLASLVSVIPDPSAEGKAEAPSASRPSRADYNTGRTERASGLSYPILKTAVVVFVLAFVLVSIFLAYLAPAGSPRPDASSNIKAGRR